MAEHHLSCLLKSLKFGVATCTTNSFPLVQAYLLDEDAGQQLLQLLQGGVTCAVDWWLALMWHYGKIDAAVCMACAAALPLCI
jgi:hypothetical protein